MTSVSSIANRSCIHSVTEFCWTFALLGVGRCRCFGAGPGGAGTWGLPIWRFPKRLERRKFQPTLSMKKCTSCGSFRIQDLHISWYYCIIASLHHEQTECPMSILATLPWVESRWNQGFDWVHFFSFNGQLAHADHWTHSRMISGFVPQVTSNIWKPKSTEQFSISEGLNGFQLWSWDLFLDIKHQSPFLVHQAGETCEFHDGLLKFKTRDCTESNKTQAVAGVRGDFASSCLKIPEGASRTQRSQSIEIHANSTPQEMLFQRACKPGMSNDFVSRPPMKSRSHPTTATVEKFSLSTQPEMQVRANWVACYPTGSRPWAVANSHSLIPQYHVIHDQFIHIRYISPPRLDLLRWCFRDFRKLHGLHAHKRCGRMLDGLPDGLLDGFCDGLPDGLPDGRGRLRNAGGIGLCICDLSGLLVCTELVDRFRWVSCKQVSHTSAQVPENQGEWDATSFVWRTLDPMLYLKRPPVLTMLSA